ncbi:MAG: hypothetical protein ABF448_04220 [Bifidobacterium aquikefiri]|uniref:hypothetical protein n=1 Tax=Bifidobacterium aquikefiri TaxID=1653207 RepID=UPI0039E7B194
MDTASLVTILASAVGTGIIGSSLTQLTKRFIADKWRTLFALGITLLVSLIGAGIMWALVGTYTWAALVVQLLAALGVAQGTYALVKRAIPDAQDVNVTDLVKRVEDALATIQKLTAKTLPATQPTTDEQSATEVKQTTTLSK